MAKVSAESNPSISNPQNVPLQQPIQSNQNPSNVFSFGFGFPPNMNLPQNAQIRTNNGNPSGNVVIRAVSTDGNIQNLQNLSQTVNNLIGNLMGSPQNVSNQNITQNNNNLSQSQPQAQPQNQSNPIIINNNNNNQQNNVQNNDVCYLQSFYINFNLYYFQES